MATAANQYRPDYAIPPGWILQERLGAHGISHAEFARRCGRSAKLISEIVAGKAPIEPKTALQFEKVLGVDATIWLGIESDYRLHLEREAEARTDWEATEWSMGFPVDELVKRGVIAKPSSNADRVSKLLSFFGVASVETWRIRQGGLRVAYRHSPSFKSNEPALRTWLRLGEMKAAQTGCSDYNAARFKQALTRIRALTATPSDETLSETQRCCLASGVVLAIIKPLPKTALSGATRWLTSRKALIQLSARHMSDDQLWFSFFHEAAHILIHGKKDIFVHETKGKISDADEEADDWATNFLVPIEDWDRFTQSSPFGESKVVQFANEQGIAPGIVVGRLQHEKRIPWNHLNRLKVRLKWDNDAG